MSNRRDAVVRGDDTVKLKAKVGLLFQHPLFLLLIGAIFSSYLIPSWTRQWQNQQNELNAKIGLLSSIDKSTAQMITSIQFVRVGTKSQSQADYDNSFRQWQTDKQVISSQFKAYFPGSMLVSDWDKLSEELDRFYYLSGSTTPTDRQNFFQNFAALRENLFNARDKLNKRILDTPISVFSN